jgi:hypothetical protein
VQKNLGVILSAFLAAASTIAWAARTATSIEGKAESAAVAARGASSRADEALSLATRDHDTVVQLQALIPRLEKAIDRLERKGH